MSISLNPKSKTPLYLQLKNILLDKIKMGEWEEGDHLPTEFELKREYGLSRTTIRNALNEIEQEGLIKRTRGVGSIVCHKKIKPELLKLTSFSEDMISRGLTPQSKTIDITFVVPPRRVRDGLHLPKREKVWHVRRLRLANNEALGLHDLYLPPDLQFSPRDLFEMGSYYQFLYDKYRTKPSHASETITAAIANKTEASLLEIAEGAPLLIIWRTTYSEQESVMEVVRLAYIAERYEYHTRLYV